MAIKAVRGAITASENTVLAILAATTELLRGIQQANPTLKAGDLVSAVFTATADLNAVYPARAARELGWVDLAMMCAQEMSVEGSLARCIRVMLLWDTDLNPNEIIHVYVGAAAQLRPDWSNHFQVQQAKGGAR